MTTVKTMRFRPGDAMDCRVLYEEKSTSESVDITGEIVVMTIIADHVDDIVLTDGDGLTIDYAEGHIDVYLTAAQTTLLNNRKNRHYELRLTVSDKTILTGRMEEELS